MEILPARLLPVAAGTLLPGCPVVIWHQDAALRYTWVFNLPKSWQAHIRIGASDYDVLPSDSMRSAIRHKERVLATGEPVHTTLTVAPPGQSERIYEVWLEALKGNERSIGLAGVAVDVTERVTTERQLRESEARYRQLLDSSSGGIWIIDADARTTYINPQGAQMLGGIPSDFLGHRPFDSVDPTAVELARENWRRRREGIVDDGEYHMRRRDGSDFWIQARSAPLYDASGQFAGAISVFTDITRITIAEAEARALAAHLAEQDRAKDRFLMMLAHELRQPLGALLMAAELASRRADATVAHPLSVIKRQAEHIRRFVEDLAELSNIKRGAVGLRLAQVDVREILQQAIEAVQPGALLLHQRFECIVPTVPTIIDGDPDRLQQVISNLIHNAVKNSPDGAPITVELGRDGDDVIIRVADRGRGILADDLPRLFEMFMQGEGAREGSGMGLPVVKALVELHRGTVEAHSEGPDRGAEFVVRLPISTPAANLAARPGPATLVDVPR